MKQLPLDFGLAAVPRLENFIAQGNEAAVWHVQQAVANPQRAAVPTYLWGETGSGKSHLLQAVVTALREQGEPVGWLDAQTLHPAAFDDRWQAVVLDDCHLFTPHQQAVAFNWFVNAQTPTQGRPRWVLAAGALPPADLKLREDLRTRLGWGQVFHVQALADARRAVELDPTNPDFQRLLHQLESGGDAYATYSAGYPNSGFGTGSWCADMCLLNLCCNPCFSPCC